MKPITVEAAHARAAALCSRSEHAKSEIMAKLTGWGLMPAQARDVVELLVEENFIDEARYARAYTHDKHAYNGWGRIKIAFQLRAKHVPQALIDEALASIDEDNYLDTLHRILQGKWREVSSREPQLARAAMLRFAAGRGYEPSIIYDAVDKVMNHGEED